RTPSRTRRPAPICATRSPSTSTAAWLTRWTSALTAIRRWRCRCPRSVPRGEPLAVEPVVVPLGSQVRGQGEVVTCAPGLPGQAQRPPEAEVRIVVDRMSLHHGLELGRRLGELAVAKVGAAERLADGALLRRPPRRLGERLGRRLEASVLE